ncbi:PhoX family protein [Pseudonocardia nigra]|uniref:PhoX family protein n=1 Tax=Pseudonocardia nigra TaxID=1921578 RepID=UPI001C5EE63A|nr:alkaline phosphatase PhoX [Pseudonocardia nigra]
MADLNRRAVLRGGAGAIGAFALSGPFQGLLATEAAAHTRPPDRAHLRPVPDLADGEVRLWLPEEFSYRSFNPTGSPLSTGGVTPPKHDGMASFPGPDGTTVLVRNHEINGPGPAFGRPEEAYDRAGQGGCVTLVVSNRGEVQVSAESLTGTQMNCSGGPMPWGSWISCEETVNGPDVGNDFTGADNSLLTQKHGYLFEVPTRGASDRTPIRAAGRFLHESAVYDPHTAALYLTEDNFGFPSGFYRYLPPRDPMKVGKVLDGGRLQMLAVEGVDGAELHLGQEPRAGYRVRWVDIDDPDPTFAPGTTNEQAGTAVGDQGRAKGAAVFSRLEGASYHDGVVYFVSTQGGATAAGEEGPDGFGDGRGQVWAYHTRSERLQLMFESPSSSVLDMPDNVTASKRGTLVLCEDGDGENFLRGLRRSGTLVDLARLVPPDGDPGAEFAGPCFSADMQTLFVNVQSDEGRSFAIWGPWHKAGF